MFALFLAVAAPAQIPLLPPGAQTKWVVAGPEEIVSYLIFDPATVKEKIPSFLRFITIGELAAGNVSWAKEHLEKFPAHADWGISFVEIVRMKTFAIDGRSPQWPENGAAALWFARGAASDPAGDLGLGKPFLALEFLLPDRKYVAYMRGKGHYAGYGNVKLSRDANGDWLGSIEAKGLSVAAMCSPAGEIDRSGSAGMQMIFPPANSGISGFVRIAFTGHQIQSCAEGASWKFAGVHPMAKGMVLGSASFQFGYDLIGGAYRK
ncbi:MAG: hypothetical protein NTW95_01395 [Candidatus Aminicenantes bacterium]|nr:hypothetical protein [Candidatus Aminicenantes bacterium]